VRTPKRKSGAPEQLELRFENIVDGQPLADLFPEAYSWRSKATIPKTLLFRASPGLPPQPYAVSRMYSELIPAGRAPLNEFRAHLVQLQTREIAQF